MTVTATTNATRTEANKIMPLAEFEVATRAGEPERGAPVATPRSKMVCREICEDDLAEIASFLAKGFPSHDLQHWQKVCQRLVERPWPKAYARFGWLLETNGSIVGCIFTIYTVTIIDGVSDARCSTSSWFVEAEYRGHGMRLARRAVMHDEVTYFNPTPGAGTERILEHLGYYTYCRGHFFAFGALERSVEATKVYDFKNYRDRSKLRADVLALLEAHDAYGCICLVCETADAAFPFVFLKRVSPKRVPYAQVLYCRRGSDIIRFAGPLGRKLAFKGLPFIAIDSHGPIRGLKGWFMDGRPIYFKGPQRPRLGDLAHTELAFFAK